MVQPNNKQILTTLQFNSSNDTKLVNNKHKMDETNLLTKDVQKLQIVPKRPTILRQFDDCDINLVNTTTTTTPTPTTIINHQRAESPSENLQKINRKIYNDLLMKTNSKPGSPAFRRENSTKSLRSGYSPDLQFNKIGSECGSNVSKPLSDAGSIRSWASVGMGSTDGKKMIVRRVPTSPVELFNIVNPPTFATNICYVQ